MVKGDDLEEGEALVVCVVSVVIQLHLGVMGPLSH